MMCCAGGASADALQGGAGTDTASYFTGSVGVVVNLVNGSGSGGDAQGDTLSGIENLSGSQGHDSLIGTSGANTLQGWTGNDVLTGAGGKDTLTGGAGGDRFVYGSVEQSVVGADADRITDFSHAQADKIDLAAIDANTGVAGDQGFSFIGTGLYTGVAGNCATPPSAASPPLPATSTATARRTSTSSSLAPWRWSPATSCCSGDRRLAGPISASAGAIRSSDIIATRAWRQLGTMEDAMDRTTAADHGRQRERTARIAVLAALPTLAVTAYAALASNSLTLLADLVLTLLDAAGVLAVWLVARRTGGGNGVANLERLAGAMVGILMLASFCVVAVSPRCGSGRGRRGGSAEESRPAWPST